MLHNPLTPAPSCCSFQETPVTAQGIYGCGKDYLILIPFRLPQISYFTLSLKCFSSDSDNCPTVGIGLLLHFPHLPSAGPVLLTLLFFPQFLHPTEFCVVLYILLHCSGTPVCSQLVFRMHFCVDNISLMYPWRQMYSTCMYSSTIFFYPLTLVLICDVSAMI